VMLAGPGDAILKENCSSLQFLDFPNSEQSEINTKLKSKFNKMYEPENDKDFDMKLDQSDRKLVFDFVNRVLSKSDIQALYQMFKKVSNGQESLGISSPQIHIAKRMFVGCQDIVFSENRSEILNYNLEAFINPEIIDESDELSREAEGCLSFPGVYIIKSRPAQIRVRFYNMLGEKVVQDMQGFPARIFQHELDHLNGIVMLDHVNADPDNTIAFTAKNMLDYVDQYGNVLDKYK
jgi:peptide deformylase